MLLEPASSLAATVPRDGGSVAEWGYRARASAGSDPLRGKRHDLTEIVPARPRTAAEAEKARTRLLSHVDEQRNPQTRATGVTLTSAGGRASLRRGAGLLRAARPTRGVGRPAPRRAVRGPARRAAPAAVRRGPGGRSGGERGGPAARRGGNVFRPRADPPAGVSGDHPDIVLGGGLLHARLPLLEDAVRAGIEREAPRGRWYSSPPPRSSGRACSPSPRPEPPRGPPHRLARHLPGRPQRAGTPGRQRSTTSTCRRISGRLLPP